MSTISNSNIKLRVLSYYSDVKAMETYYDVNEKELLSQLMTRMNIPIIDVDLYLRYSTEDKDSSSIKINEKILNQNDSIEDIISQFIQLTKYEKEEFMKYSSLIIYKKNFFGRIDYKTSMNCGYIVPVFIISYYFFSNKNYSLVQILAFILSAFHFTKRTYETNYVNIYSGYLKIVEDFIPFVLYYWILFGFLVSYNIFHPEYTNNSSVFEVILFSSLFLFSEYNNYSCHMILKQLKEKNKGFRGIPKGNLFEYTSCAHYSWELFTWFVFFLLVRTLSSFLFVIYSFISMYLLGKIKHDNYLKTFGKEYPNRKVIIPFIL